MLWRSTSIPKASWSPARVRATATASLSSIIQLDEGTRNWLGSPRRKTAKDWMYQMNLRVGSASIVRSSARHRASAGGVYPRIRGPGEKFDFPRWVRGATQGSGFLLRAGGLLAVDGQPDFKSCFTGAGFKFNFASVTVADDAVADDQAKTGAGADGLCSEKWL